MHRRIIATAATIAILVVGMALPAAASEEGGFAAKINAERTSRGLAPLEIYWDLVDDARAHSGRMMSESNLYHNPNLGSVTTGWYALGENVGVGPTVDVLHEAFMNSPGHRANILNGDWDYMGVGVVVESDTKMWVTVVFMDGPAGLVTPVEPEPPAASEPPPSDPAPEPAPAPVAAPKPAPAPAPTPAPKAAAPAEPAVRSEVVSVPREMVVRVGSVPGLHPYAD